MLSYWCRGRDSNPRRRMPTDLQSAVFDRFTTPAGLKDNQWFSFNATIGMNPISCLMAGTVATTFPYRKGSSYVDCNTEPKPLLGVLAITSKNGADGGSRTHDPLFTKQPLWPLSYVGVNKIELI